MSWHRLALAAAALLASSMAPPAWADRLDDDLNAVWESTWDQRGTPLPLKRWEQPLRYRLAGADAVRHRPALVAALTLVAQAAGLQFSEATGPRAVEEANLVFHLVDEEGDLDANFGCETRLQQIGPELADVRIRMRPSQAWSCVLHELMHAMGISGHPAGKTVLSYFPWRQDVLMDLDRLLLSAWYDRSLPAGATPFELLQAAGRRVVAQTDIGVPADAGERRRQAHFEARVREMEAFAGGDGDVPMIVRRSGLASGTHIEAARVGMAYYLGLAYLRATGVARDDAKAVSWLQRAAGQAHAPAQVQLARALIDGTGASADPVEAHRWLSAALRAGSSDAARERVRLEQTMSAAQLERARALGPR